MILGKEGSEAEEGASGGFSASHGISAEIPGKACDYRLSIIVFTATRVAVTDCK